MWLMFIIFSFTYILSSIAALEKYFLIIKKLISERIVKNINVNIRLIKIDEKHWKDKLVPLYQVWYHCASVPQLIILVIFALCKCRWLKGNNFSLS